MPLNTHSVGVGMGVGVQNLYPYPYPHDTHTHDPRGLPIPTLFPNERHYSSIIKIVHSCLLLMAICSLVQSFALIDGLVRYCGLRELCGTSVGTDDASPDGIHLGLWNEILWVIEWQAVTRRMPMSVMEVAIHGNMNVATLFQ